MDGLFSILVEEPAIAAPKRNRVNREINIPEVRLIGADGNQVGVVRVREALEMAEEAGMDLVEIVPTAEPPVCRLMDYGKFRFDQKKKQNEAKKKQKQVQIKEIKFRPGTDEGDYQVKLRNLMRFLQEGDKAKVTMRFRGREHAHRELGLELLKRIETDLTELSIVESQPQMEGRQMVMVLGPKKK
ncbi:translation initiation factor IF-3 [uncultured Lamprocystis sp.]|jgi:translation initiation factor IF-3|uniref:translation initiation factor IF-3 n=1 Tax=uncultured Lamprocystis sp. TaxID=543132 RepID=UPI0025EB1A79|nr:translation initiation factor IF-3 [uncultured Lamprocystis sp.]